MLECPLCLVSPAWDLVLVLFLLSGAAFEPLSSQPLLVLTVTVLFLLPLATAKRMGELQAFSFWVASQGDIIPLPYFPEFIAKTKSGRTPIPRSFVVRSLSLFNGDLLESSFLCSVHAVRFYLALTSSISLRPRSLFVLPWHSPRSLSRASLLFFLCRIIIDADATPWSYSIWVMVTSAVFLWA